MGEETKNNRNRNTALVLIGAGLFLLLDHTVGFFPIFAVGLILLGIYQVRSRSERKGYIWIIIGAIILLSNNYSIVVGFILIALGYFYYKSKQTHRDDSYVQKQKLIDSIRLGKSPGFLRHSSIWYLIGETNMELCRWRILEKGNHPHSAGSHWRCGYNDS